MYISGERSEELYVLGLYVSWQWVQFLLVWTVLKVTVVIYSFCRLGMLCYFLTVKGSILAIGNSRNTTLLLLSSCPVFLSISSLAQSYFAETMLPGNSTYLYHQIFIYYYIIYYIYIYGTKYYLT